jgi:hypothetical protein
MHFTDLFLLLQFGSLFYLSLDFGIRFFVPIIVFLMKSAMSYKNLFLLVIVTGRWKLKETTVLGL